MVDFIANRADLENRIVTMHARGWAIRALARHFDIGRNTVRRILRQNVAQREQGHDVVPAKIQRTSKLDAYRPLIDALLTQFPDITGVRMYEKLVAAGFDGKKTIVCDLLRKIRPRPKKEPVVRFETQPGEQAQMDWSPYTINFTDQGKKQVLCFSWILGFSRRQYIDFTLDRKFFTLIRRHQDAFVYFNGLARTCLYDGEKTVVLRWEAGQPVFNPAFSAFATHYNFRPIACRPRRAKTKGKVERPFQYVETNLLNARKFKNVEHLRAITRWWMANRSDTHCHATTGTAPVQLFLEKEQAALLPLPAHLYDTAEVALRVCGTDGFVQHDTNFYSVPFQYVTDILTVKASETRIIIYSPDLVQIACHRRQPMGARKKVEDPDHRLKSKVRYGLEPVKQAFLQLGEHAQSFLDGLKSEHPRNCGFQARFILSLKQHYHCDDIHAALAHANRYHAYTGKAIERILKAKAQQRDLESVANQNAKKRLENLPEIKQRPLSQYCRLLEKKD